MVCIWLSFWRCVQMAVCVKCNVIVCVNCSRCTQQQSSHSQVFFIHAFVSLTTHAHEHKNWQLVFVDNFSGRWSQCTNKSKHVYVKVGRWNRTILHNLQKIIFSSKNSNTRDPKALSIKDFYKCWVGVKNRGQSIEGYTMISKTLSVWKWFRNIELGDNDYYWYFSHNI